MPSHNFLSKTIYMLFADEEKASLPSDVDKALNEAALLCDEIIDVAIDIPPQLISGVSGDEDAPPRQPEEAKPLKVTLLEALSHKMPHLIEYQRQGNNRFKPDAAALRRVEKKLQAARGKAVPDTLLAPAHAFLETLVSLQESDDPTLHETEHHAFHLVRALSDALDAITVAEKVGHLAWEAQVAATADEYRNRAIAALPDIPQRQQVEDLLLAESSARSAEYQRFAQLKQSLVAESRLTRQRLAEWLQQQADIILSRAHDARLYAMDILLKRADRTAVGRAEQCVDGMQAYQIFAYPETGTSEGGQQSNPLMKELEQGNAHEQLIRHLLQTANMLGSLTARLKQVIAHVAPDAKRKEADKRWHCAESRVRNLAQVAKRLSGMSAKKKPSRQPTYTEAVTRAVRDSALLLLDAIQQTERRIKQIPTAAGRVADAVEHYQQVTESRAGEEMFAELNHLLTQALVAEAARWHTVAHHAQQQLEALIHPITQRTADEWAGLFHAALLEALRDVPQPSDAARTEEIDNILRQTAEGLSQLGRHMQSTVIPLARLGDSGRLELNKHLAQWSVALKGMKAAVKKSVSDLTGRLLGSFSHSGMLIRAISDWAAEQRQEYLRDFPWQEKAEAAIVFDQTLLEVIKDNRSHFAKKSDPQAAGFLSRLQLALQYTAEGELPTPAEIVAGMRSLPKDIQRWAERGVTTGAITAMLKEGCRLDVGSFSLPVRVLSGAAQSGGNLSCGDRSGNTALLNVAFRLTLSLSPTTARGGEERKEFEKAMLNLPQTQAWTAGFAGARGGMCAAVRECVEQALAREVATFIAEAAIPAGPAAKSTAPFAKDSPRRRAKRAADSQQAPSRKAFYPLPGRETAIDSQLENKVKAIFPFTDKGIFPASDVFQASSLTRLYRYKNDLYLFISGRYWYIELAHAELNNMKGTLYANKGQEDEYNPVLPVYFSEEDNRWHVSGGNDLEGNRKLSSGKKDFITTHASARLSEKAEEWPTESAYRYPHMAGGQQGQAYFDGVKHYIYLAGNYWLLQFNADHKAYVVLDKARNKTITLNVDTHRWELEEQPGSRGVTTALLAEINGWDHSKAYNFKLASSAIEGEIYKRSDGELYIFLGGAFWPYTTLTADSGGVSVAISGKYKVVIIKDKQNYWDYGEETNPINFRRMKADKGIKNRYYPLLPRPSEISDELLNKVRAEFPVSRAYRAQVKNIKANKSRKGKVYYSNGGEYLYINGLYYRVFDITKKDEDAISASLYALDDWSKKETLLLPVVYQKRNDRWAWYLAREEDRLSNVTLALPPAMIMTTASNQLISEAIRWPTGTAMNYDEMIPGEQGRVYVDGQQHYIYLHNKYWPVELKADNEAAIVLDKAIPIRIYRDAESKVWELKSAPGYKGATATLLSDVRGWSVRGAYDLTLSGVPCEGGIYCEKESELYLYLAGRFWPCKKLSDDLYGILVTAWGMKKVVIISDVNGYWDYADQTDVEKFNAFLDIQKNITHATLETATKERINQCLTADNFISWSSLVNLIVTVINKAFHQIYLNPEDERLITIIMLRKKILDTQTVANGAIEGRIYEGSDLFWDQKLLSYYWEAFNIDITDLSMLNTARYARILADDAQAKYNKINKKAFEKERRKLGKINAAIVTLNTKISEIENSSMEYNHVFLTMAYYRGYSDDFKAELKIKEEEKRVVQSIITRTQKKRDAYHQLIESYKEKYQPYEEGMALGDNIFTQRLALQRDKSDIITAAKEAVAELALKEVKLRQKLHNGDSERVRKQVDTLRIARASVKSHLVQQQTYVDLTDALATINIDIPAAQNTYADIVWANKITEEIYPKLFAEEENAAAHDLLPAMLHWLQMNKKSVSHLKKLCAQDIIDTYVKSRHQLNPLTTEKDIPEGYTSLSEMLGRDYFLSKRDYNQQFIEYKRKYSGYEASERVRELLIISGLSLEEITAPVKKRIRLDARKKSNVKNVHAGELLFIQLKNNNWVFFSIFPNATFHRHFTDAQMQNNPWLKVIANLEPHRVHSHGLESVFTEAFFKKQFGHANEKNYWDGARRAAKEKKEFINHILYKKERGMKYPNPFSKVPFGGTEYSVLEHEVQPNKSLVVTLNISMQHALNRSANNLKSDLYQPSALHRIACVFIPFYADIYGSLTDDEYQPDGFALMADIFGVVCIAAQVGAKIGALIKNAKGIATIAHEAGARGLTGKGLYKYMLREMGKQGIINTIKLAKIGANTIFDLVDSLMLRDLSNYVMSKVRAAMIFHNVVPGHFAAERVGKEFIRMDIVLKDMEKQTLLGGEVYMSIDPKTRLRVYYIETANGISEVRWSQTTKAWRTVDPKDLENPGQIMRAEESKWVVSHDAKGSEFQPEMGIQRLRNSIPDKKIAFNTQDAAQTEGVDAQSLLKELYKRDSIKRTMNNPAERSEYSMASVGNFMLEKGFENIRYRGVAVFVDSGDRMPANHFVVIGAKNNRDYVFDLTAGEFSTKYDELNGPVILAEKLWAQKYANINGASLIKYADYQSRAKAAEMFGTFSEYTRHGPKAIIPDAKVLRRPEWYYPDLLAAEARIDNSADIVKTTLASPGAEYKVMSRVRCSQLKGLTTDNATDYVVDVLEHSELVNKETAGLLRQGIKRLGEEGRAITEARELFDTPRQITSQEVLLCVEEGEMLFFFKPVPAGEATATQPLHVMVSIGNGRFAGINNSMLDETLTNAPSILLAEQLGDFTGTQVKLNAGGENVQIFAARPAGLLRADKPAVRDLASTLPAGKERISGLTDLLAQAGKLSPEQAQALSRALQPVVKNPAPVYGHMGAIEDVLISPVSIKSEAEMMAVPGGHLVTFMQKGKSNGGHVMYSLGDGEFVIVDPARLDASLADKSAIIHASEIPSEVMRRNVISAGDIALKKMRVPALLGAEGAFTVEGSTLSIKAMAGPGAVNSMDAHELADTIRGLAKCENVAVDLTSINEIKLYSHFGTLGRVPVGKALAYLLDKKVTAYPAFYSPKLKGHEALLSQARTFFPKDLSADELAILANQQRRHQEYWSHMRALFGDKGATESVEMSSELKELLIKVAEYIRGKVSIEDFLDGMPHFTNGLMIMKVGLKLLYDHKETNFDGYVSLSCDVLAASRFGIELLIHFFDK